MGYLLQRPQGNRKQYISELYESTLEESKEYTYDFRQAEVFPTMPKAHKFLKHYKLGTMGFDIEFTMRNASPPSTHIKRQQPFQA